MPRSSTRRRTTRRSAWRSRLGAAARSWPILSGRRGPKTPSRREGRHALGRIFDPGDFGLRRDLGATPDLFVVAVRAGPQRRSLAPISAIVSGAVWLETALAR